MNPDRAIALILAVSLAGVLLLGVYLLTSVGRVGEPAAMAPQSAAAAPSPAPSPTVTAGLPAEALGFRLAGTVVGDLSYAIIVDPQGNNQLYRPGQIVPGLGEVRTVEADRITLAGNGGPFVLRLAPGPTETPTAPRAQPAGTRSPSALTPERSPRARSASESSP